MDYNLFCNTIISRFQEDIPEISDISVSQTLKNNGTKRDMLLVHEKNINVSPAIYLDYFFNLLNDDNSNFEEIYALILGVYKDHRLDQNMSPEVFTDFNQASSRIVYRLINRDMNTDLLKDIPYIEYLDLAIIFCYIFPSDFGEYNGYIILNKDHLKLWDTDVDSIMEYAKINTPILCPPYFTSMEDMLALITDDDEPLPPDLLLETPGLFVLTNEQTAYGSAVMLYDYILSIISTAFSDDFYIIPCSTHECLITPCQCVDDPDELKDIISIVNSNDLPECDILSDNLYIYDRREKNITIYQ